MPNETRIVSPGAEQRTVVTAEGEVLAVPAGWELLPPGDGPLTKRVKADGPTWTVKEREGRRTYSRGVWAPADRIAAIRSDLEAFRSSDSYAKKEAAREARREREQAVFVEEFRRAILEFLNFAPCHAGLAGQLADAVTEHAAGVGSGTVARTRTIPIEQRAEAAVIAWMRHNTTGYDNMQNALKGGIRDDYRRMLNENSRLLLQRYRRGDLIDAARCPLQSAFARAELTESNA